MKVDSTHLERAVLRTGDRIAITGTAVFIAQEQPGLFVADRTPATLLFPAGAASAIAVAGPATHQWQGQLGQRIRAQGTWAEDHVHVVDMPAPALLPDAAPSADASNPSVRPRRRSARLRAVIAELFADDVLLWCTTTSTSGSPRLTAVATDVPRTRRALQGVSDVPVDVHLSLWTPADLRQVEDALATDSTPTVIRIGSHLSSDGQVRVSATLARLTQRTADSLKRCVHGTFELDVLAVPLHD